MRSNRIGLHNYRDHFIITLAFACIMMIAALAHAHGGKHSGQFTHLQALQKGTELFDKLIDKGKLDESWESGLINVAISMRKVGTSEEIVVAFKRESGDPHTVFIFLKPDGKYAGSNFTGE